MIAALRRLGMLLLLALLTAGLLQAAPAAAAPVPALRAYGACLLGQRTGDLLILFDESGSLEKTDEPGLRADAAAHLVNQLAVFAQDRRVDLSVAVAGFSDVYRPASPWTAIGKDADGRRSLIKTIDGFRTRVDGYETDYWTALDGARRALVDRAKGNADRCQAMVWFTDGRYNLVLRDTKEELEEHGEFKPYAPTLSLADEGNLKLAREAGEADICRPRGVADQLRARHITLLAVGLNPNKDADFGVMEKAADGPPCGELADPSGHFWHVDNVNDLIKTFEDMANPNGRPLQHFVVDNALSRVHIYAEGAADHQFIIDGPDQVGSAEVGAYQPQGTGSTKVGTSDVTMNWTWLSPDSLVIDLTRGSDSWLGLWSVNDSLGAPVDANTLRVSFSGDLLAAWPAANAKLLIAGDQPQVALDVARANGDPVQISDISGEIELNAKLVAADGTEVPIASGLTKQTLGESHQLDLSKVAAGPAEIQLDLTYTTVVVDDESTTLDPQLVTVPVTVLSPPDRGQILGSFDFGAAKGQVDQAASIEVSGPSCVWLPGTTPEISAAPDAVDPVSVTSEHDSAANCLQVAADQTDRLTARLTTGAGGNGSLVGVVEAQIAPLDEPQRATPTRVEFSAEMLQPIDAFSFLSALIAALVLGLGLPVGLLYAFKYWTARIPGEWMQAVAVPLTLRDGEVLHNGVPLSGDRLPPAIPVNLDRNGSRTTTAAGVPLQTSIAGSPFGPGFVRATKAGSVGLSSTDERPHGIERFARLPLACHNTWALFHDPAGPADRATLLLLQGHDADANRIRSQVDDARRQIPGLIEALRADSGPGSSGGPGGTGSGGSGSTSVTTANPWGLGGPTGTGPGPTNPGSDPGNAWGLGTVTTAGSTRPGWGNPPGGGTTGNAVEQQTPVNPPEQATQQGKPGGQGSASGSADKVDWSNSQFTFGWSDDQDRR